MPRKVFSQVSVLVLFVLALLATPVGVRAGGICGGSFIVEPGQTLDSIAAICGTTVAAITAANPGISGTLSAGQVLIVPGINGTVPSTPVPTTNAAATYNYNYYNTYNYYGSSGNASVSYNGTYTVRPGDTFSAIASRFGVTIYDLWAANPYIWDINLLYVGQVLNVPSSTSPGFMPSFPETPAHLSYGTVPAGAPKGQVILSNKAKADVYVSLQGETRDGTTVINEYTVNGNMSVTVPAGWYVYVAWVGGRKFVGQFNLGGGSEHTLIFYSNKVVVQ